MKIILMVTVLMFASTLASAASSGRQGKNSSSWSILYGYSKNIDKQRYNSSGYAYKFQFGNRFDNNLEANFLIRYAAQTHDLNFSSVNGSIKRTTLGGGIDLGYWIFSALKLHVGYAFHSYNYTVSNNFSNSQISSIKSNYDLKSSGTKGLFAGADLVLFQSPSFQLFSNYDYYHFNHEDAHDWEAMLGIRFYPGSGKGGGSGAPGWFSKVVDKLLASP